MDNNAAIVAVVAVAVAMASALLAGAALIVRDTIRRRGRWGINLKPVVCPGCDEPAPVVRKPRNRRQMMWGGCTCAACGLEYDKWGVEVPGETDPGSGGIW